MTPGQTTAALVAATSLPYLAAGRFACQFARGKLKGDPVFAALLELGLLQHRAHILDLGCGQGLLAAWLLAAHAACVAGRWPAAWPAATRPASLRGIDMRPQEIARAQRVLGHAVRFTVGDIRRSDFGSADAIVILDVLHYMDYPAQQQVLQRVRGALVADGVLLLRVGDADGGLRSRISYCVDHVVQFARDGRFSPFFRRTLADWRELLAREGFRTEAVPMSAGTPFADVLLICRPL